MINNETSIKQVKPDSGLGPINKQRRSFIGGAMAAVLAASRRAMADEVADEESAPNDPFIVLLHGIYQPVPAGNGPAGNLGLTTVNLNSGFYSKTQIYPIFGVEGANGRKKAIGTFYPEFTLADGKITANPPMNPGLLCAYDLPGGAIAMQFLLPPPAGAPAGFDGFVQFQDGTGGYYLEGTFELKILEATGVYRAFQGGHNHMVDRLHQLANGQFDEFCFCNISQYQFP